MIVAITSRKKADLFAAIDPLVCYLLKTLALAWTPSYAYHDPFMRPLVSRSGNGLFPPEPLGLFPTPEVSTMAAKEDDVAYSPFNTACGGY